MVKQKVGCIYRLTNLINGKKYIGKTVHYRNRMTSHKCTTSSKCCYLKNAIKKYGWSNFKQEIIVDKIPEKDLSNLETSYITSENTMAPNGYNLTKGGEGISGYRHKEKALEKFRHREATRAKFGSVHFCSPFGKWKAVGPRPRVKYIGHYNTEQKARDALEHYNKTGICLESDRVRRKKGTGSISKCGKRYRASIMIKRKKVTKTCDTEEQCEEFLNKRILY